MSREPAIGALVMAAGQAARMGRPKLTLPLAGRPVIAHVLEALAQAGLPALVVTGAYAEEVRAAIGPVASVHAPDHALGLARSLRAGLAALPAEWAGVLVALADMPAVRPATYRALAAALRAGAPAVVPVHAGRRGNPAGLARASLPALRALEGDRGARALLDAIGAQEIAVDDPGVLLDLDRPEDLARISAWPLP